MLFITSCNCCFAGIARAFTYGGSRNRKMHDPAQVPRTDITKSDYTSGDAHPTTINHFAEKLLKLKDLMKSEVIRRICLLTSIIYLHFFLCYIGMLVRLLTHSCICFVQAGKKRAIQRHEFMLTFLQQFYFEWEGQH